MTTDTAHLDAAALTRQWIPVVTLAEFLGFTVPTTVGVLTVSASPALVFPRSLSPARRKVPFLAGDSRPFCEGPSQIFRDLDGSARQRVRRRSRMCSAWHHRPGHPRSPRMPLAATIVVFTVLGFALLTSMGTAQWPMLRSHVTHGVRWIPTTACAWLAGLAVFLGFAMPLWHDGQSMSLTILVGIGGGFLMAATTSVVAALGLRRILP